MKSCRFTVPRLSRKKRRVKATYVGRLYKLSLAQQGKLACEAIGCGYFDPMRPYGGLETHHVRQVSDGGADNFVNFVALCSNHHAIADLISFRLKRCPFNRSMLLDLLYEYEKGEKSIDELVGSWIAAHDQSCDRRSERARRRKRYSVVARLSGLT
jgi:hypothetical protein